MLNLVVENRCTLVDALETPALVADDIPGKTEGGDKAHHSPDTTRMSPWKFLNSGKIILAGLVRGRIKLLRTGESRSLHAKVLLIRVGWLSCGAVTVLQGMLVRLVVAVDRILTPVVRGVVVGNDPLILITGQVEAVPIAPEQWTHWDMPETKTTILFDKLSIEIGKEEGRSNEPGTEEDAKDDSDGL